MCPLVNWGGGGSAAVGAGSSAPLLWWVEEARASVKLDSDPVKCDYLEWGLRRVRMQIRHKSLIWKLNVEELLRGTHAGNDRLPISIHRGGCT